MTAIATQTINLDLRPHFNRQNNCIVYCSQYDNDLRNVVVNIADAGTAVNVSTYTIYIEGTKPDKKGFSYELTDIGGTVSNNVVTFPLQLQMTACAGITNAELVFYSGDDRIGSANFILAVEKAGLADDIDVSDTDIPAYVDGAQQAAQAAEDAKDAAVDAKDTAVAVAASIPEDYTTLSNDVDDLKSAIQLEMIPTSFTWVDGDFDANGNVTSSTSFQITDFIDASPLGVELNGASALYIYYYNASKVHISHETINTDRVVNPQNVSGCAYYRLDTRATNVPLLKLSAYPAITNAITELQEKAEQIFKAIELTLSNYYERGLITYSTGKIAPYASGFVHSRTAKYLQVAKGTAVSATYTDGTLYVYEYSADKTFIKAGSLPNGTTKQLDANTEWLRFQHDNYTPSYGNVVLTYTAKSSEPYWGYGTRDSGNTIPFGYQVYPCYATDEADTVTTFTQMDVFTSGLLMLPPNYTEDGAKVPVIYFAHGSADYIRISDTEFSASYMDYLHYLRDEGYAVFDCYGWTDKYTTAGAQMANPTNMAAIKQGLKWVCENYNVDINRVYVSGKSLGGLQAINMCYEGDFYIKACFPLAPAMDASEIGFGYDVNSRKSYCSDLCFSTDTQGVLDEEWSGVLSEASANYKAYALANADKLLGYNPLYRNLIGVDASEMVQFQIDGEGGTGTGKGLPNKVKTMNRICNVPTKIACAVDDNAVSYDLCDAYVQSIKNTGGLAEIRALPANTGKHHAVDNDANALKVASITTKCGVAYTNVPLAYAEMVQFFRRFS